MMLRIGGLGTTTDQSRDPGPRRRRRAGWRLLWTLACLASVGALGLAGGRSPDALSRAVAAATQPACFGAASRDPLHPCDNPRLRSIVTPSVSDAQITPNAPCTLVGGTRLMHICAFGVAPGRARASIALVGDSHASHWRAALEVVAQAERWQGLSNTRSSCSFSTAVKDIRQPDRTNCSRWNHDVEHWFAMHPEVHTTFVAEVAGEPVIVPPGGDMFEAEVRGYIDAWNALPRSVHHVIVIRDTPKIHGGTLDCINSAAARRQDAGSLCAVARAGAISRDPAEVAALRLHSSRVQVVDLNDFICDSALCYPVVGGVLVFKDLHHLTTAFDTTLGPYLLRDIARLGL
jgi:hypothetical protein